MGMNVLGLSSDRLFMSLSEMPEKRMVEIISAPALESVEVGLEAQSEIHDLQSDDGNKVVPIVFDQGKRRLSASNTTATSIVCDLSSKSWKNGEVHT